MPLTHNNHTNTPGAPEWPQWTCDKCNTTFDIPRDSDGYCPACRDYIGDLELQNAVNAYDREQRYTEQCEEVRAAEHNRNLQNAMGATTSADILGVPRHETTYYDQSIEVYDVDSSSEMMERIGAIHPDLVKRWDTLRIIGHRGESAKHSVVEVLRRATGDIFNDEVSGPDDGAEVFACGQYYLAFTTRYFLPSVSTKHRVAVTTSPNTLAPNLQQRDITIRLRVTESERDQLHANADAEGVTLSQYIRSKIL